MNLRLAQPGDAAAIAALHTASWRQSYQGMLTAQYLEKDIVSDRLKVWESRFQNPKPGQYVVIADDQHAKPHDRMIGFACAFGEDDPKWGTLLDNLHVVRGLKRHGIGTQLMANVAQWCAATYPGRPLYLFVFDRNFVARKFYERLGAVEIETVRWDALDGTIANLLRYAWTDLTPLICAAR